MKRAEKGVAKTCFLPGFQRPGLAESHAAQRATNRINKKKAISLVRKMASWHEKIILNSYFPN